VPDLEPPEALVSACEEALAGPMMDEHDDEEDVMVPPSGITFGMIRRARAAIEAASGAGGA
jgi:hypothetical protein